MGDRCEVRRGQKGSGQVSRICSCSRGVHGAVQISGWIHATGGNAKLDVPRFTVLMSAASAALFSSQAPNPTLSRTDVDLS